MTRKTPQPPLDQLWLRLSRVRAFHSSVANGPNSKTGWSGETHGTVDVTPGPSAQRLDFIESGELTTAEGKAISTHNHWQWTHTGDSIQLAHRRRDEPILLAELRSDANGEGATFHSASPHLCGADIYELTLTLHPANIELVWKIKGPKKDETLQTRYSA
jgi:hypothetical protein